ncbi:MAG: PKD domain-containing protein [Dehalococcoidia bacterium]
MNTLRHRFIVSFLPAAVTVVVLATVILQAAGLRVGAVAATQTFALTLDCAPLSIESGEETTCTAGILFYAGRAPLMYGWTPEGEAGADDNQRVFRFDNGGEKDVSVRVCVMDDGGQPTALCEFASTQITVDGPLIEGLSCDPPSVNDRESTTCRLAFADERADIEWTAGPNVTNPSDGVGREFTTQFTRPDVATITARGCVSSAGRAERRCTELSTTVEVSAGPWPAVSSLSCAPDFLEPGQSVSCSATVENDPNFLAWSAIDGNPAEGRGLTFGTTYTGTGRFPITFIACVTDLGEPRCDQATTTVQVGGMMISPRIRTPGCTPDLVPVNGVVSCTPEVIGGQDRFSWTARPDASTTEGGSRNFGVRFSQPGDKTITLRVCSGPVEIESCDELSQPITVTSTAPAVEAIACNPVAAEVGRPVTCAASTAGPMPTTWSWTAESGSPATGSSPTFTTTFAVAGVYRVQVQVCVSDRCDTGETAVTVTPRAAVSLSGRFTLTQVDGGNCNPTFSPVTEGTISFEVTYPENPSEPARVTGSLDGGGSGTIAWRCDGLMGSAAWTQRYDAMFTGTVDRATGVIISISGTIRGSRTVHHSNCHQDGRSAACPAGDNNSYSFPLNLTGTLLETSGSGTLIVDRIALSTSGRWNVP